MAYPLNVELNGPPQPIAGIQSWKCGMCPFEFVHIEPEETILAALKMSEHLFLMHGKSMSEVPVHCQQH
jgi:hypothetical protein